MEWNDVRIFLALIRSGSVRSAAKSLAISHATVARRVDDFEKRLGVKLFNRLRSGYELTKAGEDLIHSAENVEAELHAVQRKLIGQDKKLSGDIRITATELIATYLLLPSLPKFMETYPQTFVEINETYTELDLTRGEADIALRIAKKPPEHLIARKLADICVAEYASETYIQQHDLQDPASASRISNYRVGQTHTDMDKSLYAKLPIRNRFNSYRLGIEAAKAHIGITKLPCFVADKEPTLVRISDKSLIEGYSIWMLRHPDTRSTSRLRVFCDFVIDTINQQKAALESTDCDCN